MKRNMLIAIISATLLLILAVVIKSYNKFNQFPTITLPAPAVSAPVGADIGSADTLSVTPENVCTAVSTLSRTESYSRTYSVKSYWQGGKCEDSLSVWQRDDNLRMSISHAGSVKNLLILGNELYIWYNDATGVFSSTHYDSFDYTQTDKFARLITYEELFALESDAITDAGYSIELNEPCIFAEYIGDNNYVNRLYISVNSGLLVSAEIYEGETLIYEMESKTTELSTPSDDVFTPPSA